MEQLRTLLIRYRFLAPVKLGPEAPPDQWASGALVSRLGMKHIYPAHATLVGSKRKKILPISDIQDHLFFVRVHVIS